MELLRDFKQLNKDDVPIAGGKGASLGEMTKAGIPVPPGFVILAEAFEKFLEETDLNVEIDSILHSVDTDKMHTVEDASEKIRSLIVGAEIPIDIVNDIQKFFKNLNAEYVAVRSSATAEDSASAAWAGQLESYLNTTEENLLENVKKCWASLFTPRAIFYRFEKNLHKQKISVAVVVQKMVESEKSGIVFSVHPVTQDRNQLIIEAGFGLGEAIVSGQITPDSYVVEKQPRRIIDKNVETQTKELYRAKNRGNEWKDIPKEQGEKQVLSDEEILELSDIILKIENHYNFPCDVEWVFDKNFFIVQSRPITTLSVKQTKISKSDSIENYQQLFQVRGNVSVLLSSLFINHYKHLKALVYFNGSVWKSLLPLTTLEQTLDEGVEIYKSKERYEKLKDDLENAYSEAKKFFEQALNKEQLEKDEVKKYLHLASHYFLFYQKTEFFYTDRAFEKQKDFPQITENFKTFEGFKLQGRKYLNSIIFEGNCYLNRLVTKVSNQLKISPDKLHLYTPDEMEQLFEAQEISDKELEKRRSAFLMKGIGDTVECLWGNEAKIFISRFEKESDEYHLHGKIAHGGRVKGKAKVFNFTMDQFDELHKWIDEMEAGQILVAESTAPEIISACKKASAIITNQGGMMSHAAIVARELKIPCIVGTGNATEAIQDGQEIEVDADEGIITLL